jgi:hypothetical protein
LARPPRARTRAQPDEAREGSPRPGFRRLPCTLETKPRRDVRPAAVGSRLQNRTGLVRARSRKGRAARARRQRSLRSGVARGEARARDAQEGQPAGTRAEAGPRGAWVRNRVEPGAEYQAPLGLQLRTRHDVRIPLPSRSHRRSPAACKPPARTGAPGSRTMHDQSTQGRQRSPRGALPSGNTVRLALRSHKPTDNPPTGGACHRSAEPPAIRIRRSLVALDTRVLD